MRLIVDFVFSASIYLAQALSRTPLSTIAHCNVSLYIVLHRLERCAAQHIEEACYGLGGFEEFRGGDGVVFFCVDGNVGEGAFGVVEIGSSGRKGGHA